MVLVEVCRGFDVTSLSHPPDRVVRPTQDFVRSFPGKCQVEPRNGVHPAYCKWGNREGRDGGLSRGAVCESDGPIPS